MHLVQCYVVHKVIINNLKQLAFLTPCDQAFNPPFLGGKIT